MPLPTVSPDGRGGLRPSSPAVTADQVQEALDWVELMAERASVTLPEADTRQGRELQRAVCAYAVSLQTRHQGSAAALDAKRLVKLKDGDEEITYAPLDTATATASASTWLAAAWRHMIGAGIPRPSLVVGASG